METQIIEWIKDDIKEIRDDLKGVKSDVTKLLQFKWQIIGGTVVVSLILTTVFQIVLALFEHK
jgi:hypothetical protein